MLFNSWQFVGFFLVVLACYWSLPHRRQNVLLLVSSYLFYAFWDWRFLSLLLLSTVVDYTVALAIESSDEPQRKKRLVTLSVLVNLGILSTFKYYDFFIDSAVSVLEQFGIVSSVPLLNVILPLGISFYTFQTMAYTIDVYRGKDKAHANFINYAIYVTYFPQLVAGPIERASRLIPQIDRPRSMTAEKWSSGAQLVLWGYVKKVAIADTLAPMVDVAFENPASHSGQYLFMAMYCFAIQIYCDFSGYTDIARGISRMLGIELVLNFRAPYLSHNIAEFWRRWHISLSTWLRDYLYIPLGGNRRGKAIQYRNLMVTMLLGGLWHGAGWTYILWGGLHGLFLAIHRMFSELRTTDESQRKQGRFTRPFMRALGIVTTFHLVCLAWIPFRSPDWSTMIVYLQTMFSPRNWYTWADASTTGILDALILYGTVIFVLDLLTQSADNELPFNARHAWWVRGMAYGFGLILIAFIRGGTSESFIYFQF